MKSGKTYNMESNIPNLTKELRDEVKEINNYLTNLNSKIEENNRKI